MEVYGLVGDPVAHSASPPMHHGAFEATGRDATYVPFRVPADRLPAAIEGAAALGVSGLNVTVPHKQAVLDLVEPSTLAARTGAVNTIAFEADGPRGYNTDAAGATRALREDGGLELAGATVVVLGAGGAGRAVAHGCADAGATVHVANRTESRARELADGIEGATAGPLGTVGAAIAEADALVNATMVGMEEDASPVPADALSADLVVLDAVYAPRRTRLLCEAAAAGARTVDGTRMLLYQGAAAFERWTGETAPVEAMARGLETALEDRD